MPQSPIQTAITQICQEKNISEEDVLHAIELALAAAYRKDFGNKLQNIVAEFDLKTGGVKVSDVKTVVEDIPEEEPEEVEEATAESGVSPKAVKGAGKKVEDKAYVADDGNGEDEEEVRKFNPKTEIQVSEAKELNKKYKIDDEIVTPLEVPGEFGRMAAQTAKQVIIQRIREIERDNVFEEYKDQEGQVIGGAVQRREGRNVLVDLERATAIMPFEEQIAGERYSVGNRMKFYLVSVDQTGRGPQLVVSRAHNEIVSKIFELEIPEVASGAIEIKAIAREAGYRSKVAIHSTDDSIDPIGSCVGQRGARIQTIISELSGEKIDIILWDEDPIKFITNALSPAKVVAVELKGDDAGVAKAEDSTPAVEKVAIVTVKEDQLSLAIGRSGQNVRLASKLSGWKIDIVPEGGKKEESGESEGEPADETDDKDKKKKKTDPGPTASKDAGDGVNKKKAKSKDKDEVSEEATAESGVPPEAVKDEVKEKKPKNKKSEKQDEESKDEIDAEEKSDDEAKDEVRETGEKSEKEEVKKDELHPVE